MFAVIIFLFFIVLILDAATGQGKRQPIAYPLPPQSDTKQIRRNVEMSLREKRFGYKAMEARKMISEALRKNPGIGTEDELLKEVLKK